MVPTHQLTFEPPNPERPYERCHYDVQLPLRDIEPGRYDVFLHTVDELGAAGEYPWHYFGGFTLDPTAMEPEV